VSDAPCEHRNLTNEIEIETIETFAWGEVIGRERRIYDRTYCDDCLALVDIPKGEI
jgi:hypothetical protein